MSKPTAQTSIDFRSVAEAADLRSLIVAELGEPGRGRKWNCPFHDDSHPSMGISPDGKRFRCWSCGAAGTALDWVMLRDRVGVLEAARQLDPSLDLGKASRPASIARRPVSPTPGKPEPSRRPWRHPDWQAAADALVIKAERLLWSKEGRPALDWLLGRGLVERTIRAFRLGFLEHGEETDPIDSLRDDDGRPRGIRASRGIVIPWVAPGSWYSASSWPETTPEDGSEPVAIPRWSGVNVRKLMPNVTDPWTGPDKCRAFAGSERGFAYPHADLTAGVDCMITEGEIDALLAFQEVGHCVNVVTTGGASTEPKPETLDALSVCPAWLIATDLDDAGDDASARWRKRGGERCRRLQIPVGKDVGEFVESGGSMVKWLGSELDRLGLLE